MLETSTAAADFNTPIHTLAKLLFFYSKLELLRADHDDDHDHHDVTVLEPNWGGAIANALSPEF